MLDGARRPSGRREALAPGSYYAAVTVENPWGSTTSEPIPVTLSPLARVGLLHG